MSPVATAPAEPPPGPAPIPPADLVASLPAPLLRLLILFSAPIAAFRAALEVLCWKPERRVESYMVVGVWWSLCLGFGYVFAWLLPPLLFAPLLPLSRLRLGKRMSVHPSPGKPATTESLLHTIGDLHKIHALLPPSPIPNVSAIYARFRQLGTRRLVRGLVVLWLVWIVLDRTLGNSVLLALVGTAILLLPSPPLAQVVNLLSKSLVVRRATALLFLIVFGSPPDANYKIGSPLGWLRFKWAYARRPSVALAFSPPVKIGGDDDAPEDKAGNPIYFRFELHENQRWWMGLDWTSALLPQERPSWCDSHLLPVSPPVAFQLPPPSSIDLPAPTKTEPRAQIRRTATWRWLDDDWSVVRTGQGATVPPSTAVAVTPIPTAEDTDSVISTDDTKRGSRPSSGLFGTSPEDGHTRAPSIAEQAFVKGLGRLKTMPLGSASLTSPLSSTASPTKPSPIRGRTGSEASTDHATDDGHAGPVSTSPMMAPMPESDEATDADGWVYGDNKWENMTARGGLGKFTRRRRWQRRAVCTEAVHRIAELAPLPGSLDAEVLGRPAIDVSGSGSGAATPTAAAHSITTGFSTNPTNGSAGVVRSVSLGLKGAPTNSIEGRRSLDTAARPVRSDTGSSTASGPTSVIPPPAPSATAGQSRDDALRQRLKKAMGNMGA